MLSRFLPNRRRDFDSLSEREILALAISSEEDDGRVYRSYADWLREDYPDSARIFEEMAEEEDEHRRWLIEMHREKFGERIPLIRRAHVNGFYDRTPDWLVKPKGVDAVRRQAADMEAQACRFYSEAARRTTDASIRRLLGDLARAEADHIGAAMKAERKHVPEGARQAEGEVERRRFILTFIQPGLAGLMDGSVSTLAPVFATAFATQDSWTTFLVGMAASVGAGISMGFTEVASDDGVISGRGSPVKRGLATGIMTTVGGLGHALPYLIADFWTATALAIAVVFVELWAIAFIQHHYMETPWSRALFQVVLGGALVFGAGVLIGGG
jgi:erythrin-vacuolar iron transport family protein